MARNQSGSAVYHEEEVRIMHPICTTPPAGTATLSRRLLVGVGALFFGGALLTPHVAADRVPAHGASIADRVENQKELCQLEEGDFSESKTAFGSVITKCTGGNRGDRTCVNTAQSTDCHKPLTRPPGNIPPPPTTGDNTTRVSAGRTPRPHRHHGTGQHRAHTP